MICTQTLQLIYPVREAVANIARVLKPGGVVLATVPGIAQLSRPDATQGGDYWRFTSLSVRRMFEESFDAAGVTVTSYGNVKSSTAFLYGLAAEDLKRQELELNDPDYDFLIGVRAVKRRPNEA
jgi:hypothetical protein